MSLRRDIDESAVKILRENTGRMEEALVWDRTRHQERRTNASARVMDHPRPASASFLKQMGPFPNRKPEEGGPKVKHLVLFQMANDKPIQVEQFFKVHFPRVLNALPGVESYHSGAYSSFEGFNKGYNWAAEVVFRDQYSRDFYVAHEEHEKLVQLLEPLLENGFDSIVAFDMLI